MHKLGSVATVLSLFFSPASATELMVFHTAHFADDTVVTLSLVSNVLAAKAGYDYDVAISVSQQEGTYGAVYNDPGKHRALVRCSEPAKVSVRGKDYAIPVSVTRGSDWKVDLWIAVCSPSVS